jgi:WD40 repeat protein
LDFTYDDAFLLSGSADETIMIWSMEEEVRQRQAGEGLCLGPPFDAKFFADGSCRTVAPDDTNSVHIMDNGKSLYVSPSDTSRVTAVAIATDAETVVYGCENGAVRYVNTVNYSSISNNNYVIQIIPAS